MLRRTSALVMIALGLIGTTSSGWAGWPTTRGDAQRTGFSPARGAIATPGVRWRYYLGGQADRRSFRALAGSTATGTSDLIFLTASARVEARRADDVLAWRSGIVGADRVVGVADLDGDARPELVAISQFSGRAFVFDARSGALRWSSPPGRYRQLGVAHLRDVDGDGRAELYLSAWGSFSLQGPQWADLWSFGRTCGDDLSGAVRLGSWCDDDVDASFDEGGGEGGFIATRRWSIDLTTRDYDRAEHDAWADVDGDGRPELVAFGKRIVYVYSSVDGALIASGDIGSIPFAQAQTIVANLDRTGDPGEEVIVFTNTTYGAELSTRHVMVLDVAGGVVTVRWTHAVADVLTDLHAFTGESVADVDGDGALEVVSSFSEGASGTWTTTVWRGATGAEVTRLPGLMVGAADVDGDGAAEVLTRPGETELGAAVWDVTGVTATRRWERADARWLVEDDPATASRQSLTQRTIRIDVDGDGRREVVLAEQVAGRWRLVAFDLAAAAPAVKRTYALPADVTVLAIQRARLQGGERLLVARADGYLAVLDRDLAATNELAYPTGTVPGIRLGGFFPGWRGIGAASALAGPLLGDLADDLVVRDSRGALLALDPAGATISRPPVAAWAVLGQAWMPALTDIDGDGRPEVATAGDGRISVRDAATGAARWTSAVAGQVAGHLTAVDIDGDGRTELGHLSFEPRSGDQVLGLLRPDGSPAWPAEVRKRSSGRGSYGFTDVTGDGVADTIVQLGAFLVSVDGATGAVLSDKYSGFLSMAPLLADVDADADHEIVSSGFYDTYATFDVDPAGATTMRGIIPNRPTTEVASYHYGALVRCSGGPRFVFAAQNSGHLRVLDPAALGVVLDAYLVDGAAYPNPAAMPATGAPAYLGNINALADLGDGEPRALVGSTDGHLYALRPCADSAGALIDWSLDLGAPVGEPIPADVDGDGEAEVVVAAQDGYLYAIDHAALASPRAVGEVSAAGQLATGEVDELGRAGSVIVEWAEVAGAASYEVAVVDGVGASVTAGFVAAGAATSRRLDGLALAPGLTYYTVVRAVAPDGTRSFEQLSDGFRLAPDPGEDGDASTSGGGQAAGDAGSAGLLGLGLVVALRRRRRARGLT